MRMRNFEQCDARLCKMELNVNCEKLLFFNMTPSVFNKTYMHNHTLSHIQLSLDYVFMFREKLQESFLKNWWDNKRITKW